MTFNLTYLTNLADKQAYINSRHPLPTHPDYIPYWSLPILTPSTMRNLRKALRDNLEIIPGKVAFRNDHHEIFTKFCSTSANMNHTEFPFSAFIYLMTGSQVDRNRLQSEFNLCETYFKMRGTTPTLRTISYLSALINTGSTYTLGNSASNARWQRVTQIMELVLAGRFFEPNGVKTFYAEGVRTDWFLEQIRILRVAYVATAKTRAAFFQGSGHPSFLQLGINLARYTDKEFLSIFGWSKEEYKKVKNTVAFCMASSHGDGISATTMGRGLVEKRNIVRSFRRMLKHTGTYRPIIAPQHFPLPEIPNTFTKGFSNTKISEVRANYQYVASGAFVRSPLVERGEPHCNADGVIYPYFMLTNGTIIKTDDTNRYVLRSEAVHINTQIPYLSQSQKDVVEFIKKHHKFIHNQNPEDSDNHEAYIDYLKVTNFKESGIEMVRKLLSPETSSTYKSHLINTARYLAEKERPYSTHSKLWHFNEDIINYRAQAALYIRNRETCNNSIKRTEYEIALYKWENEERNKTPKSTKVSEVEKSYPYLVDFSILDVFNSSPRLLARNTGSPEAHLNEFNKGVSQVKNYIEKIRRQQKDGTPVAEMPVSERSVAPTRPIDIPLTPDATIIANLRNNEVKNIPETIMEKYKDYMSFDSATVLLGRNLSEAELQVVEATGIIYLKELYDVPESDDEDDDTDHTKISSKIGHVTDIPMPFMRDSFFVMERRTWDLLFDLESNITTFLLHTCKLNNIGIAISNIRDEESGIIEANPDVVSARTYLDIAVDYYRTTQTNANIASRALSNLRNKLAELRNESSGSFSTSTPEGQIRRKFQNTWAQNPFKKATAYLGNEHLFTRGPDTPSISADHRIIRQYTTDAVANGQPFRDVGFKSGPGETLRIRSGLIDKAVIDTKCYLGVELEVLASREAFKMAHDITTDIYKDLPITAEQRAGYTKELGVYLASSVCDTFMKSKSMGILKHDGSVGSYGFEVVSVPGTHQWHLQEAWKGFFKEDFPQDKQHLAPSYYLSGWANNGGNGRAPWCFDDYAHEMFTRPTCGIHVHVSKNALTPLQLGKMLMFVNKNERGFIEKIAGRTANQYTQFYDKTLKHGRLLNSNRFQVVRNTTDQRNRDSSGRYEAINITSAKGTVEFRIFRSNVSKGGFFKCIDFVQSVVDWTRNSSIRETNLDSYLEFLHGSRGAYPWLIKWLVENSIIERLNTKNPTFSENTFQG